MEEEKRLANVWKICQRTYVHNFVYIYMRGFFSHLYNVCTVQMYRMYNVHMYSMLRGEKILYAVQSPLCICTEILIRNSEKQKYFTRREICIPGHPRPTRPNEKYYSRTLRDCLLRFLKTFYVGCMLKYRFYFLKYLKLNLSKYENSY